MAIFQANKVKNFSFLFLTKLQGKIASESEKKKKSMRKKCKKKNFQMPAEKKSFEI